MLLLSDAGVAKSELLFSRDVITPVHVELAGELMSASKVQVQLSDRLASGTCHLGRFGVCKNSLGCFPRDSE